MSVAICNSSTVSLPLEKKEFGSILIPSPITTFPTPDTTTMTIIKKEEENHQEETPPPRQLDIWTSIQSQKSKEETKVDEPYVHPLVRRSSGLLSQKSLEICTESLGSETGSDEYVSSGDEMDYLFSSDPNKVEQEQAVQNKELEQDEETDDDEKEYVEVKKKELSTVNYHCSIGSSRRSPPRSFPPPLPSISNRGGPCFQMRPHRKNGRLVVQAVAVPSQNYLHSERQDGRLVLSFIETKSQSPPKNINIKTTTTALMEEQEVDDEETMEMEDQEEEEEVEVVDRGTVVEVKVSTQATKVHRSSIVINKFVSCTLPSSNEKQLDHSTIVTADYPPIITTTRRTTTSTTTAAAAAVAASSLSTFPADGNHRNFDNKLLFTSKRRNSEELLRDMRRCNQLRKPLFIWEPCCIATSS